MLNWFTCIGCTKGAWEGDVKSFRSSAGASVIETVHVHDLLLAFITSNNLTGKITDYTIIRLCPKVYYSVMLPLAGNLFFWNLFTVVFDKMNHSTLMKLFFSYLPQFKNIHWFLKEFGLTFFTSFIYCSQFLYSVHWKTKFVLRNDVWGRR